MKTSDVKVGTKLRLLADTYTVTTIDGHPDGSTPVTLDSGRIIAAFMTVDLEDLPEIFEGVES